ncbi:MAG: hypothetical protein M0R48_11270 [Candidatus Omnitrophica bacterium]|nr:hypothetical protein [Candidatus Omnitrophota bacterium]
MPKYIAVVTGNYIAESANTKTPSVKISFKTESDAESGQRIDRTLYADLWLSEKAIKNSVATLDKVFNWSGSLESLMSPVLVGKRCQLVTEFEDYQGDSFEKVKFVNPEFYTPTQGVADSSVVKNLSAKFDAAIKNYRASKPAEDDTPF